MRAAQGLSEGKRRSLQALAPRTVQSCCRLATGSRDVAPAIGVHSPIQQAAQTPFLPLPSPRGGDLFLTNPHNEGTTMAGFGGKHKGVQMEPGAQQMRQNQAAPRLSSAPASQQCQGWAVTGPRGYHAGSRPARRPQLPCHPQPPVIVNVLYSRYTLWQTFMNSQNHN